MRGLQLCYDHIKLKKFFYANKTLLARTAIAEHRARNLQEALQIKKKKRQQGKRLNLAGNNTSFTFL